MERYLAQRNGGASEKSLCKTCAKKIVGSSFAGMSVVIGLALPMKWSFYNWNEEQEIHGDVIGTAESSNVKFISREEAKFPKPDGAVINEIPWK